MTMAESEPMCPERLLLEHVTSRWGTLALIALLDRPHRFGELRREIGSVSEKMLTQTLRTLERDGLVHRDAKPVIPPRVDYSSPPSAARPPNRSGTSRTGPSAGWRRSSGPGGVRRGQGVTRRRPRRRHDFRTAFMTLLAMGAPSPPPEMSAREMSMSVGSMNTATATEDPSSFLP